MKTKRTYVAVGVVVNNQGEVLLTQRYSPENPKIHMKWQLPGGAIEKDETAEGACIREVLEETGFNIKLSSLEPVEIISILEEKEYILRGFRAVIISGTIDTKDEETNDIKWFKIEDLQELKTLNHTEEMVLACLKIQNG